MISVDPEILHAIYKYYFAINCETCDTDAIAGGSYQCKMVVSFVDLVQTETMFEIIEATEMGF